MVLKRNSIQSTVESSPELLHAVAASASVWGASLQVLELKPASPVSACTRWPPSLRSAVLLNPRVYSQAPIQSHWESQFLGRLISLGVPKERGVWNSQGGRKTKFFFPCTFLRIMKQIILLEESLWKKKKKKNFLANPVVLKCKLWECVQWGLYNLQTFLWFSVITD